MKKIFPIILVLVPEALFAVTHGSRGGGGSGGGACSTGLSNVTDFKCLVSFFVGLLNDLVPLIIGLAVFLFIFGLIKYITAGGNEDTIKEARNYIIFGIVAIAVMFSIWGLVNLVLGIFFPDGFALGPQFK
jgi:hypothetical protein